METAAKVSLAWSTTIDVMVLDPRALGANAGERWAAQFALEPRGAVLVRPDGHVAWRSGGLRTGAVATMTAAFSAILGRAGETPRTLSGTILVPAYVPSRRSA